MPQRHRSELSESVTADALGRDRRVPRTFRAGRECAVPGCRTVLSIYNGAKHCAAHGPKNLRMTAVPTSPDPERASQDPESESPGPGATTRVNPGTRRERPSVRVDPSGEVSRRAS